MQAESTEQRGQARESCAGIDETLEEIPVHRVVQRLVHRPANPFPERPPPEERHLRHIVVPAKRTVVMLGQEKQHGRPIVLVDHQAMAVHRVDIRVRRHESRHRGQRPRHEDVVRVEIRHDLARRAAESGIDGRALSGVRTRLPPLQALGPALEDGHTAIGRAAVLHDVLEGRIPLFDDAGQRALEEWGLVECRRDDRDDRAVAQERLRLNPRGTRESARVDEQKWIYRPVEHATNARKITRYTQRKYDGRRSTQTQSRQCRRQLRLRLQAAADVALRRQRIALTALAAATSRCRFSYQDACSSAYACRRRAKRPSRRFSTRGGRTSIATTCGSSSTKIGRRSPSGRVCLAFATRRTTTSIASSATPRGSSPEDRARAAPFPCTWRGRNDATTSSRWTTTVILNPTAIDSSTGTSRVSGATAGSAPSPAMSRAACLTSGSAGCPSRSITDSGPTFRTSTAPRRSYASASRARPCFRARTKSCRRAWPSPCAR